jgi:hypothetical protein
VSRTVHEAARRARVPYSTLRHWLQHDEEFRKAYTTARRQMVEMAVARVQGLMTTAVSELENLLHSKSEGVRLRAVQVALNSALQGSRWLDDHMRMDDLEIIQMDIQEELKARQRAGLPPIRLPPHPVPPGEAPPPQNGSDGTTNGPHGGEKP